MDRFQILKGISPPPEKTKDSLEGAIPIDIDIFGEEYPGTLIFLHKTGKHGLIEFRVPEKDIQENISQKEWRTNLTKKIFFTGNFIFIAMGEWLLISMYGMS